ncbi:hypothetical protein C8J30_110119 [Rhodobacter viridis]|uniref:DDE family transposase n=1 Tax=Rhodobacter viridis TaxID=1054202 RepID=A0A318U4I3_9RHOB|nr:hypothetical protein C8J30_110119 [Rhodobacter viridis]
MVFRADANGARCIWRWTGANARHPGRRTHPSSDGDSPVLQVLLARIPEGEAIGTATADRACDTRRCHSVLIDRLAIPIIPIRKNGRAWKEDCPAAFDIVLGPMADTVSPRNETLRATRHYGRAFWKR